MKYSILQTPAMSPALVYQWEHTDYADILPLSYSVCKACPTTLNVEICTFKKQIVCETNLFSNIKWIFLLTCFLCSLLPFPPCFMPCLDLEWAVLAWEVALCTAKIAGLQSRQNTTKFYKCNKCSWVVGSIATTSIRNRQVKNPFYVWKWYITLEREVAIKALYNLLFI